MEKLTYTHNADAAAVIAQTYDTPPLAYVRSYGCQQNVNDGEKIRGVLMDIGFGVCDSVEQADLILFNTCAVREHAEQRVFGNVGALKKLKEQNPRLMIGVCGCMAQQEHIVEKLRQSYPYVDLVFGVDGIDTLPQLIAQKLQKHKRVLMEPAQRPVIVENIPIRRESEFRAWLPIMYGCDNFCTYCIIPYARGRCRSMPLDVLQQEVSQFAAEGYTEIVLCGINLAFYGKEWGGSLLDAVSLCCQTSGIQRVRLGSLEPERMTEDLLDALAALPAFCPQFHLSLQSGCDHTLKEMHRRYTTQEYAALCAAIRSRFPVCAITTDIMVGFPGETDADFAESLAFAESMQFAKIHVFRYSPRTGTPAAKRTDQIPDSVKHTRMVAMQQLAETARTAFLSSRIGLTLPVLFERERDAAFHNGHTPDFTPVKIPAEKEKKSLRKSIFYVRIEESDSACCFGHIVPKDNANSSQKE